ncbi:MAG: helix-turn-helix domain-containing protein [Christensenellales bacterium]
MIKEDAAAAVQRMQAHIEKHLHDPITLVGLAKEAGYSPWHAARMFKEALGKAPFDYVRARRLTEAALRLRDEKLSVIDVALDFVFDSQEGFTRAFSKAFGIPPARYGRETPAIRLFLPRQALEIYRATNKKERNKVADQTRTIFVQVIERPQRRLLLKRGLEAADYFAYCDECGCEVFDILTSVREALYEPAGLWLPKHLVKEGTSQYVQGVELPLSYEKPVPEGFELITLPPCSYLVFQGEPYSDEYFMDEISSVWAHIERFDPKLYGYDWAPEEAPRFQLEPQGYRGYIEAWPVKKLSSARQAG